MVEDCTQLILDGLEVNRRVGISVFVAIVDQLILLADNLLRSDAAHFQLAEVGQQLGTDNVILTLPGTVFDAVLTIFLVTFDKVLGNHVKVSARFVELFPFPSLCLSFRLKASLLGLFAFSGPVCIAVDYPPCIVFLIPCKQPIVYLEKKC